MILASLHFCFCSQSGCENNNVFHMDLYQGNVHESNRNVVSNSWHCTKAIVSNLYFFSQLLYRRQLGPKHSKHEAYLEEYGGPLWWRDSSITSDVNIDISISFLFQCQSIHILWTSCQWQVHFSRISTGIISESLLLFFYPNFCTFRTVCSFHLGCHYLG